MKKTFSVATILTLAVYIFFAVANSEQENVSYVNFDEAAVITVQVSELSFNEGIEITVPVTEITMAPIEVEAGPAKLAKNSETINESI